MRRWSGAGEGEVVRVQVSQPYRTTEQNNGSVFLVCKRISKMKVRYFHNLPYCAQAKQERNESSGFITVLQDVHPVCTPVQTSSDIVKVLYSYRLGGHPFPLSPLTLKFAKIIRNQSSKLKCMKGRTEYRTILDSGNVHTNTSL
ncbi:hypothetical protein ANN_08275 [Periplaneta americana]|uniref:Uncharacterized protein n=1 Tax=Periplaneta americana TaxID=6978 RepID=A0ABQ8T2H2_PERAM|nr:hypothetical protein ANN_08275 [Periplaneta americana]